MSTQDGANIEVQPNVYLLVLLYLVVMIVTFIAVMIGSVMIGNAFGDRTLGYGMQMIGNALLIPIMSCFAATLFTQK